MKEVEFKLTYSDNLKILESKEVLMLDWDMNSNKTEQPANPNYAQTITINKRTDVLDILSRGLVDRHIKNWGVRLYWTPNGVRGFITSHLIGAGSYPANEIMRILNVDQAYLYLSNMKKVYHCRISPKVGRENDYVACFWTNFGNKEILPSIIPYLKAHDALCKSNRGDADIPDVMKPTSTLEEMLRSKEEEPWEKVHDNVLSDFLQDLDF